MGLNAIGGSSGGGISPGDDAAQLGSGAAPDGYVLVADGSGGADWEALVGGGGGTVTSVAVSGSDGIEVDSGSPITASGTISLGVNASNLKTHLSLNNVENTALSTWAGSTSVTTIGTIATGTVPVANVSGLGDSATKNTGTSAGTVAAGDHTHAEFHSPVTVSGNGISIAGQQVSLNIGTGESQVAAGNDARFTDSRNPTAHASSHVTGGSDKIRDASASQDGLMTAAYASKLDGIAASANNYSHPNHTGDVTSSGDGATTIANLAVTAAKISSGVASNGHVLTSDGAGNASWSAVSGANGGTVTSVALSGTDGIEIDSGSPLTSSGTIALGINSSTLKTHIALNNVENTALSTWVGSTAITTLGTIETGTVPAANVSGLGGAATLNVGSTTGTVCAGDDSRLSDARTPTGHASSHVTGGADKIRDASASQDGLMTTAYATKLDGIDEHANNYTLPAPTTTVLGGVKRNTGSAGQFVSGIDTNGALEYGTPAGAGTVTSVAVSGSDGIEVDSGSPITSSGTIALGVNAANLRTHINVADGANNYSHPNHTGDVTSTGDGATTIANDAVTYAKIQNISATSRVIGRKSSGSGDAEECTLSDILDFVGSAAQGDILYRGASGWTRLAAGTSGHYLKTLGSGLNPEWAAVPTNGQLGIVIDGAGSVITTGVKGYLRVPYNCTITSVEIVANASGSIVVDIWKDTYANFPPLVADAITGSAKPTLSSAQKSQSSTLTGWTTSLSAGDYLAFNVDSATTVSRVTVTLIVTRTT